MQNMNSYRSIVFLLILWQALQNDQSIVHAQDESSPLNATIERMPLSLRDAASYDIPLKLSAAKQFDLITHADGIVQAVRVKLADKAPAQSEAVQLDSQVERLEVERAQALLKAAQAEPDGEAAAARVEAAKKALQLAQLRLDRTNILVPFDAHIFKIYVAEGQFVRAGDPLVNVADQSKVLCEVPIDRSRYKVGDTVELKVEETTVSGTLTAILPLSEQFDPLRPLFVSIASGIIEIDNSQGRFLTGQTVYSPMIPRHPVAEVPTQALSNTEEGGRKVQVIRDSFVRDIPVQTLGSVGENHIFVSGRFSPRDELIVQSSEPLLDGTQVTPASLQGSEAGSTAPAAPKAPGQAPQPPKPPRPPAM